MRFRIATWNVVWVWLCLFSGTAMAENRAGKVIQFSVDPFDAQKGWALTESVLQFNEGLKNDGRWEIRFNRKIFKEVTGIEPDTYRHRKIQLSKNRVGTVYLMVEITREAPAEVYVLRTGDYGGTWMYTKMTGRASRRASRPRRNRPPPGPQRVSPEDEAIDLSTIDGSDTEGSEKEASTTSGHAHHGGGGGGGMGGQKFFRFLFDLLLQIRPGVNPWTFDNYHTLVLVEAFPMDGVRFSFELAPSPRYYELSYSPSDTVEIRAGRIWIPFGDTNPHNRYGGLVHTSALRQPGTSAFLPDVFTDLGVAVKFNLSGEKGSGTQISAEAYAVNGFQDGDTDPLGEVGTKYPNFESVPNLDNNTDKALGARLHVGFGSTVGLTGSVYTGRYSDEADPSSRLTMFGVDGFVSPVPGTELNAGYVFMNIKLAAPSTQPDFVRGGFYAQLNQRLSDNFKIALRGGTSQLDNRVQATTDQNIVGGALIYQAGIFRLSLQYFHDLQNVPGKAVRNYTALRAVAVF